MRSAMASRKNINIHTPQCFMAVRNCINISVLYGLEIRLCRPVRISTNYVTAINLNARMNPSSYLF